MSSEPDDGQPGSAEGADDPLGRVLGGDFADLGAYQGMERAQVGQLALALLARQAEVTQLAEQLRHKESEVWQQARVIDGLKTELRGVGATMAALQAQIAALRTALGQAQPVPTAPPPAGVGSTPSPSGEGEAAALQAALHDVEARLHEAVVLVLDEMNTRRVAEGRVQQLESVMRARGLTPPPPPA